MTQHYLQENHPEVFFVLPRPGGIANIELPEDDIKIVGKGSKATIKSYRSSRSRKSVFDQNIFSAITGYISREERIKYALQSSPWVFFEDYQDVTKAPSPMQDTIDILAIAITTIMLLAANYNEISANHLRWTYSYLGCIKDENGHTPPNVKGIMNHIKMLNNSISSFIETDTISSIDEREERNIEPEVAQPEAAQPEAVQPEAAQPAGADNPDTPEEREGEEGEGEREVEDPTE